MKFLLDESVNAKLANYLKSQSHDTTAIAQEYPNALTDPDVLAIAVRERRTLITNDRDFGELIFHKKLRHSGVIFFRLKRAILSHFEARLTYTLDHYGDHLSEFIVVTDSRVRVRQSQ